MEILVAYDVNTLTKAGRSRLRRVAQACLGHGQRVQFSVFECSLNETQLQDFRHRLLKIVDQAEDSLRIYRLNGRRQDVVESYGRDRYVDYHAPLIV